MAVFYLDVDDEITSAANRLRTTDEARVVLVLPAGSRLATSRINFRLLAREAQSHGRILSLVAPESSARALAMSAGLPVFATLAEYEDSLADATRIAASGQGAAGTPARGRNTATPGRAGAGGSGDAGSAAAAAAVADTGGSTVTASASASKGGKATSGGATAGGASAAGTSSGKARPPAPRSAGSSRPAEPAPRSRTPRHWGRYGAIAIVVLLLAAGGVAGAQFLPSATITITPRVETVGPTSEVIRADPAVTAPDAAAGVVPAVRQSWDLVGQGVYKATGTQVTETAASGSVTFKNCDTGNAHTIPAGSVVSTGAGVEFSTNASVFLPVAGFVPPATVTCQSNSVGVTAVVKGLSGNVAAGAINQVPLDQNKNVIFVTNRAATSGGTHVETKIVSKADTDAAAKDLTTQLTSELAGKLSDPTASPAGLTVFPTTQALSTPAVSPDPTTIIGKPVTTSDGTFTMSATATGTVIAVDQTTIKPLAADKLRSSVSAGYTLLEGSITVDVGPGSVSGQTVTFTARAQGSQVRKLDAAALEAQVRGKSVADARTLLAAYGAVRIDTWPGFVSTIPTYDFRVQLSIEYPSAPTAAPGAGSSAPASSAASGSVPSGSPGSSVLSSGAP